MALGTRANMVDYPLGSFKLRHGQCTIMGMDHHACAKCNAPESHLYQHHYIYNLNICNQCWLEFKISSSYDLWNLMLAQGSRDLVEKVVTDWVKS